MKANFNHNEILTACRHAAINVSVTFSFWLTVIFTREVKNKVLQRKIVSFDWPGIHDVLVRSKQRFHGYIV